MADPDMRDLVPKAYSGIIKSPSCDFNNVNSGNNQDVATVGQSYIQMEDLLYKFQDDQLSCNNHKMSDNSNSSCSVPCIMDIKMGTRTFLESEANNGKARSDLYEKMIRLDASYPTDEENSKRAVTKLRYMNFRESLSSSSNLGFRIEGVQVRLLFYLFA